MRRITQMMAMSMMFGEHWGYGPGLGELVPMSITTRTARTMEVFDDE